MSRTPIPTLDQIPEYASWVEVAKTYSKCQRLLTARLGTLGLSVARYETLLAIARDEGLSQRDLGERLLSAKSNVTGLLQRLEAAGAIRRETDEQDARGHRVFLTSIGRKLLRKGVGAQASVVQLMMKDIKRGEAQTIGRLMRTVGASLDAALDT
ncbi:MAG: MarR family transcriptional regulator [Polyangiales bacterium]|jgi:DNA-binding MarR family transcriptional regulator